MFYYSAPQAIVTCVLSITKGFCLKRLDLSHVFACETTVHLRHILACLKMCHFRCFGFTVFESCVTAVIRRKELSCLCICKHHRTDPDTKKKDKWKCHVKDVWPEAEKAILTKKI